MSEMIERVARAIAAHMVYDGYDAETRARLVANNMGIARAYALVAIEAMRKPDRKMLRAASAAMSPGKRPTERHVSSAAKHGIRYRAMIDAAIADAGVSTTTLPDHDGG